MVNYFAGEWSSRVSHRAHLDAFLSLGDRLCVYDLGASGGTPPPFCWLLGGITLINFEPDSRAQTGGSGTNCDIAIGPQAMRTLHINRRQTTSSLLPPCEDVVNRYDFTKMFPEETRIFETVSTAEIETAGLDDIVKRMALPSPDFLKIDVQGLTLEVLETGVETLTGSVLGLQTEVEFLETYLGQKTFGSVHEFLENKDFELFRLTNLNRWIYKTSIPLMMYTGQDVFCDLLYLRGLRHIDRYPAFWINRRIIQFIKICLLYDLTDTAAAFLEKFSVKKLLDDSTAEDLAGLIKTWHGALDYFYYPDSTVKKRRQQFLHACILMVKSLIPDRLYKKLESSFK